MQAERQKDRKIIAHLDRQRRKQADWQRERQAERQKDREIKTYFDTQRR
jgi:hypothetical protein